MVLCTIEEIEKVYREGQQLSVEKLDGERHGYSQVCEGVNAVLKRAGRGYENAVEVASIWHCELACFHSVPDAPLSSVVKSMESALPGIAERARAAIADRDWPWVSLLTNLEKLESLSREEDIVRRTNELIGMQIKAHSPKIRRGSKEYRDLSEKATEKARQIACAGMKREALDLKNTLEGAVNRKRRALAEIASEIERLTRKAKDVEVFAPDSVGVKTALRQIAESMGRLEDERKAVAERESSISAAFLRATAIV